MPWVPGLDLGCGQRPVLAPRSSVVGRYRSSEIVRAAAKADVRLPGAMTFGFAGSTLEG